MEAGSPQEESGDAWDVPKQFIPHQIIRFYKS